MNVFQNKVFTLQSVCLFPVEQNIKQNTSILLMTYNLFAYNTVPQSLWIPSHLIRCIGQFNESTLYISLIDLHSTAAGRRAGEACAGGRLAHNERTLVSQIPTLTLLGTHHPPAPGPLSERSSFRGGGDVQPTSIHRVRGLWIGGNF